MHFLFQSLGYFRGSTVENLDEDDPEIIYFKRWVGNKYYNFLGIDMKNGVDYDGGEHIVKTRYVNVRKELNI